MSKATKDSIDRFLDNDIHLDSRIINIGTPDIYSEDGDHEVNALSSSQVIKQVLVLESASPAAPITIFLNTPGGHAYEATAIYDILKACKCEIIMKCHGKVMSAGSIILQAADRRLLYIHTKVMLHDGEDGYFGHPRDLENWAKHANETRNEMYKIFAERSGKKTAYFRRKMERDWILSAEQAIEEGLADEIITSNF